MHVNVAGRVCLASRGGDLHISRIASHSIGRFRVDNNIVMLMMMMMMVTSVVGFNTWPTLRSFSFYTNVTLICSFLSLYG